LAEDNNRFGKVYQDLELRKNEIISKNDQGEAIEGVLK